MIYKHVKTDRPYQVISVGARMSLLNQLPRLDPAAVADMAPLVVARSDPSTYFIYPEPAYEEKTHWPRVCSATLQVSPDKSLKHGDKMVVYRGDDGRCWVRPEKEFFDGRFVAFAGVR